jgi:hypothetical protein
VRPGGQSGLQHRTAVLIEDLVEGDHVRPLVDRNREDRIGDPLGPLLGVVADAFSNGRKQREHLHVERHQPERGHGRPPCESIGVSV